MATATGGRRGSTDCQTGQIAITTSSHGIPFSPQDFTKPAMSSISYQVHGNNGVNIQLAEHPPSSTGAISAGAQPADDATRQKPPPILSRPKATSSHPTHY